MAGGIGSRFWPMSRVERPKQFIDILGTGETLIQQTFRRLKKAIPAENILVVTGTIYRDLVKEQLPEMDEANILCEPARRNTAPCIAYACHKIQSRCSDAVTIVAPSDHIILNEDEFIRTIESAITAAIENDWLITLGITPTRPDTGYGYIQFEEERPWSKNDNLHKVKNFTEKPDIDLAREFLRSGEFLWNAGIFVWSVKNILAAFEQFLPEINELFLDGKDIYYTKKENDFISKTYSRCRGISIDYGIMEKADNVFVIRSDFGWSDLGTWGSLFATSNKDENNNSLIGKTTLTYNTSNCIINTPKDKLVVIEGLDDYIVVDDSNVLMIYKKNKEQSIRDVVNEVKLQFGEKYI